MKKMARTAPGTFHEWVVDELKKDRALAVGLFQEALQMLEDPEDRAAGLAALRDIAEAYGGLAKVAAETGLSRESLYRSLGPKGNPTLKTLIAVLKPLGLRLSVVPVESVTAKAKGGRRKRLAA